MLNSRASVLCPVADHLLRAYYTPREVEVTSFFSLVLQVYMQLAYATIHKEIRVYLYICYMHIICYVLY